MYLKLNLSVKCTLEGLSQFVNVLDVRWSVHRILRNSALVAWPQKGRELKVLCIEKASKKCGWHGIEWQLMRGAVVRTIWSVLFPVTLLRRTTVWSLKCSLSVSSGLFCALSSWNCWSCGKTHWKAVSGTDLRGTDSSRNGLSGTDLRERVYTCLQFRVQCRHPLFSPAPPRCRDGIMA